MDYTKEKSCFSIIAFELPVLLQTMNIAIIKFQTNKIIQIKSRYLTIDNQIPLMGLKISI